MDERIVILLEGLDRAYGMSAWHGTTLKGSLRGLSEDVAGWRPAPDRHSVWEYLLHAAYWKYRARRWIAEDGAEPFRRSPADWPTTGTSAKELARDKRFLDDEHKALRAAFEVFDPKRLSDQTTPRGPTYQTLMLGIAAHDTHHAGQIQLLRRLAVV